MPGFSRTDRLSEQVKQEVYAIVRSLKDPRIPQMFTITYASVTPDLRHAKIGVSTLGEKERHADFVKALKGAAGFIRRELGARMQLRYVPELSFVYDDSIEYSVHIQQKLEQIQTKEQQDDSGSEGSV
jgi:ribosome-binding factor A